MACVYSPGIGGTYDLDPSSYAGTHVACASAADVIQHFRFFLTQCDNTQPKFALFSGQKLDVPTLVEGIEYKIERCLHLLLLGQGIEVTDPARDPLIRYLDFADVIHGFSYLCSESFLVRFLAQMPECTALPSGLRVQNGRAAGLRL